MACKNMCAASRARLNQITNLTREIKKLNKLQTKTSANLQFILKALYTAKFILNKEPNSTTAHFVFDLQQLQYTTNF